MSTPVKKSRTTKVGKPTVETIVGTGSRPDRLGTADRARTSDGPESELLRSAIERFKNQEFPQEMSPTFQNKLDQKFKTLLTPEYCKNYNFDPNTTDADEWYRIVSSVWHSPLATTRTRFGRSNGDPAEIHGVPRFCESCNEETLHTFNTQQLRSADEGASVFHTCSKCGHTVSEL